MHTPSEDGNASAIAPTTTKYDSEQGPQSVSDTGHRRSLVQNVVLIASVTLCMIVNVCPRASSTSNVTDRAPFQTANLTGVSISLPTIGRDLNIVEDKLQWIMNAYSLSSVRPRPQARPGPG